MEASNKWTLDKLSYNKYFKKIVKEIIEIHEQNRGYQRGHLFVTDMLIPGSSNTFEGIYYCKKHVAVKRVEKRKNGKDGESNQEEFEAWFNLMNQNAHMLPCYHIAEDSDYYYFGVTRCICNLENFITNPTVIQKEYWEQQGTREGSHQISPLFLNTNERTTKWNDMLRDIIEGVAFVHGRGYTHTFLDCSHILITDDFRPVIGNYGKSIRTDQLAHWCAGSRNRGWRAPEIIRNEKKNQTNAIDIFSLGCILHYCLHGRHLYSHGQNESLSLLEANIEAQKHSSEQLKHLKKDHQAYELVLQLTNNDPSLRLPVIEISKHPFFWSKVKSCNFIRETYEWLQLGGQTQHSIGCELDRKARNVFNWSWYSAIPTRLHDAIVLKNYYNRRSLVTLMRLFRNGIVHISDVLLTVGKTPEGLRLANTLGNTPSSYFCYFSIRYPALLMEIYKVVKKGCSYEESFSEFF